MGKFKGRNAVACIPCHSQKLKCNGGTPCERCVARERNCTYPEKKRYLSVPESYIRDLEREVNLSRQSGSGSTDGESSASASAASRPSFSPSDLVDPVGPSQQSIEGIAARTLLHQYSSTERFIQNLKQVSSSIEPHAQLDFRLSPDPQKESSYTHLRLRSESMQAEATIKFPPRELAFHLLKIFEDIFCDYHWFLRVDFREHLASVCDDPIRLSRDRNWLCRASVVFALAQTFLFNNRNLGSADESTQMVTGMAETFASMLPPGSELFEQALVLYKTSSEEPLPEDVELLNLMAFYCYSLNRRKTAFTYASQSMTLAKLLHLDKPLPELSPSNMSRSIRNPEVLNEHRKRLWWTSYCMDRMVATELGLPPTQESIPASIRLPSSANISPDHLDQFFDAHVLVGQAQICEIKRKVGDYITQMLQIEDEGEIASVVLPCFEMLLDWKRNLPSYMVFNFEDGIPSGMFRLSSSRGIASLYLRYHQCFTIILRTFYLKELSTIVQQRDSDYRLPKCEKDSVTCRKLQDVKTQCLDAARYSCRIILDLQKSDQLAKFGYWDSLHVFSSLAILSLSQITTLNYGPSFSSENDTALYSQCRTILENMAQAGNPAAKEHETFLKDVEDICIKISATLEGPPADADEIWNAPLTSVELPFDEATGDQMWFDVDWRNLLNFDT